MVGPVNEWLDVAVRPLGPLLRLDPGRPTHPIMGKDSEWTQHAVAVTRQGSTVDVWRFTHPRGCDTYVYRRSGGGSPAVS
jgi:hypothetical protein